MSKQTSEIDEWSSTVILCMSACITLYYIKYSRETEKRDHGDNKACRPMSLCFREGPEAGTGKCLGKNPKKWPLFIVCLL